MSRHINKKRQQSLFTYFAVQPKSTETSTNVTDSLEAMTLTPIEENQVKPTNSKEAGRELTSSEMVTPVPEEEESKEAIVNDKSEINEEINQESIHLSDSSEEEMTLSKRKRRIRKVITDSSDSSSEDDSMPLSVRLARLQSMKQQQQQQKVEVEQCDEENNHGSVIQNDELEYLDKSDILQERTRGKKVSRYSEALKKLSDRKTKLSKYKGEKGPIERYSIHVDPSDSCSEDESEEEEDEEEDLDGFVVDDDMIDGEKSAALDSERMEMPAEFSTQRTQSFSRQLKIYLEYLIALSLDPSIERNISGRYFIAKNAVIRRIAGYKDSIVTSDVWLTTFKEAIDKYSNWAHLEDFYCDDDFDIILCQACRANKPASEVVRLWSDTETTNVQLYLGSECGRKGRLYHQLYHFELHMYNKVKKHVTKMMVRFLQAPTAEIVYENLRFSGEIEKLIRYVRNLINQVILIYNLKSQRKTIVQDSSSDSYSSSEG